MDLNENTRNGFRQKWTNVDLILNRYQDANAEELAMAYFLIDSLAENMKHKLRHHIDQRLTGQVGTMIVPNRMGTNQNLPGRINPPQVVIPNRMVTDPALVGRAIGGLTRPGDREARIDYHRQTEQNRQIQQMPR